MREPRGEKGLEGYQRGCLYKAQLMPATEHIRQPYFRVWPDEQYSPDYYETGDMKTFAKYFQIVRALRDAYREDMDLLNAEYERYFDECERANKTPLPYAQWLEKENGDE
jgi:hypothetical protein